MGLVNGLTSVIATLSSFMIRSIVLSISHYLKIAKYISYGTVSLGGVPDIIYLRGRSGARVFIHIIKSGEKYEIIAKANKHNEGDVISKLRELYGS